MRTSYETPLGKWVGHFQVIMRTMVTMFTWVKDPRSNYGKCVRNLALCCIYLDVIPKLLEKVLQILE